VEGIVDSLEEVRTPGHEGVVKTSKVCTIVHLFCKDIRGIAFPADVCDGDATVFNPF
jgi:hypothetical protein